MNTNTTQATHTHTHTLCLPSKSHLLTFPCDIIVSHFSPVYCLHLHKTSLSESKQPFSGNNIPSEINNLDTSKERRKQWMSQLKEKKVPLKLS